MSITTVVLILLGLSIVITIGNRINERNRLQQLQGYWKIPVGMSEREMLKIMGNGYSRSLLKNGITKYDWKIDGSSVGYYYGGVSERTYSGEKRVSIFVQNKKVIEVRARNI